MCDFYLFLKIKEELREKWFTDVEEEVAAYEKAKSEWASLSGTIEYSDELISTNTILKNYDNKNILIQKLVSKVLHADPARVEPRANDCRDHWDEKFLEKQLHVHSRCQTWSLTVGLLTKLEVILRVIKRAVLAISLRDTIPKRKSSEDNINLHSSRAFLHRWGTTILPLRALTTSSKSGASLVLGSPRSYAVEI
ncbi:hypothetical protein EVAR_57963_1 [Eumeta japonica]|uniref:Uncharacterized protein n=1 Tax=Eumeta variegata TaxID=151549 RepID=A0A4C1Y0A2_EUMVA|nr:hypothetical protein EVAR_57963_1 [Eumeta japonica]